MRNISKLLILLFISHSSYSNIDSLKKNEKFLFKSSFYGGVSIGKSNLTYGNGGRYALGMNLSLVKNDYFCEIGAFFTEFRDMNYPFERHGFLFTNLATHTVNNYSISGGKQFGKRKNLLVNIGVGYLTYRQPIIKQISGFGFFHFSDIKVDGSNVSESLSLNTTIKGFIKKDLPLNGFSFIQLTTSSKITFLAIGVGIEPNYKKIKIFR